ncbi:MAG: VOC family protein [Pseudomonadota bacterium]
MRAKIIPTMRYEDAPRMIDWLCDAIGFERRLVIEDEDGGVAHAQLTLGDAMIMLGSSRDDDFGKLQKSPKALGGATQSPYIVVDDVDGLAERVAAAGGEIVYGPQSPEHGGRDFGCLDPEGHLWNFGSYDPWKDN